MQAIWTYGLYGDKMSKIADRYYVYVYIDPRNYQEFYYGKGKGDRRFAHLQDDSDTEKARIIKQIRKEGLEPIIRVVANNLSEDQALLVEKTLIWKLGRNLANQSSGHFASNFRPHDTLHKDVYGFDYENGFYYVNVGEGDHRNWDDCKRYGFISAGQSWEKWGKKLYALEKGDIIAAYLKGHGYVGIGRIIEKAVPAINFRVTGKPLSKIKLAQPAILNSTKDIKDEEHIVAVDWISAVDRKNALPAKKSDGIYTTTHVVASLEKQEKTIKYLESNFDFKINSLLKPSNKKAA
jgi:hypothetical protein